LLIKVTVGILSGAGETPGPRSGPAHQQIGRAWPSKELHRENETDPILVSGRVDIDVYAGDAVLVGVVESQAKAQKLISDARSVSDTSSSSPS